jgi:hypothetical protein
MLAAGGVLRHSRGAMVPRSRPGLLTDDLTLPARTSRDAFNACSTRFDLIGKDLTILREDLSSVRGGSRVQRLEECIRDLQRGRYLVQLLSGHQGSGKSTELRWLANELQKTKDGRSFHALFIDLEDYLDVRDTQLPELVTTLFAAIIDDPVLGPYASASSTAKKVWKGLSARLSALGLTLDAEIPLGVAKLKLNFRTSPGLQRRYREESDKHISSLLADLGDLIDEVRGRLVQQGVDDLVIIGDKLDRVERLPLDDGSKRTTHDVFFLEQLPKIQSLPAHIIVTIPVSLHFTQGRLLQVFEAPSDVVLPMVAVRARGADPSLPDAAGVAALSRLLARRVDLDTVFADEDALRHCIMQSGGSIRDLLRLVAQGAIMKKTLRFTRDDVEAIVREFVGNMERLLQGRPFLRDLHQVLRTGAFPDAFDDSVRQWLLYNMVVLEYNGVTWYDVHPYAQRTLAFKLAAPPPAKAAKTTRTPKKTKVRKA